MCDYIGAKSLKFLSLNGLYKALDKKESIIILNLVIIISLENIQ